MNAHDLEIKRHMSEKELNQKKFQAAQKYSRRVQRMKSSLPIIGGLFILVFIIIVVSKQFLITPIGIATIDLTDGQVVMDNPTLSGFTASNSEYDIVAEKALQGLDDPKKVLLEKIAATLTLQDGNVVSVEANKGQFNLEGEKLRLDNGVSIHTSSGYEGILDNADIDIKSGILSSKGSIKLKSETGDIQSESLIVRDNGAYMLFEERVRMTVIPDKVRSQPSQ